MYSTVSDQPRGRGPRAHGDHLFNVRRQHAGLFPQFAHRRVFQSTVGGGVHVAARQRPLILARKFPPFHQQHLQGALVQAEDGQIDAGQRQVVAAGVIVTQEFGFGLGHGEPVAVGQ